MLQYILTLMTQIVPGLLVLILIFCVAALRYRSAHYVLIVLVVGLLALSTAPIKRAIVGTLESRAEVRLDPPSDITHILVLNAGHDAMENWASISQLNPNTLARLVEAARLWRRKPDTRLIVTGDAGSNHNGVPQARVIKESAVWLGVDESLIVTLPDAASTAEEVSQAADVVGAGKLLVVTSAVHLPRALKMFEATGIDATGAPAHFMSTGTAPWYSFGASNLLHIDRALHEIVGSLWYSVQAALE